MDCESIRVYAAQPDIPTEIVIYRRIQQTLCSDSTVFVIDNIMEHQPSAILTIVWATAFGISAQVISRKWRIPSIVLLLFSGILLGPSVLNILQPSSLGQGSGLLVKLSVAIILFEGSLNLRLAAPDPP